MSLYLFALSNEASADVLGKSFGDVETSRDLSKPRMVTFGSLTAIVCDVLVPEVRPNRRNLLGHMRVLEAAQQSADLLPVQFGHVFSDDHALASALMPKAKMIRAEITRLAGLSEVAVRVSAERDPVIAALSENHPDLKARYAAISAKGAGGHFDLIELGRRVGEHLTAWRETVEEQILTALGPIALARHVDPPTEDIELLRGDFLIRSQDLDALEAALASVLPEIPYTRPDDLSARIVGPVPPCRFVELDLSEGQLAPVGSAA